jgi:hypothetical protein
MRTEYTHTDFESWSADDLSDWDYEAEPIPSQFRTLEESDLPSVYHTPQEAFPKAIVVDGIEYTQTQCQEDMYSCYYAQYRNPSIPDTLYELIN